MNRERVRNFPKGDAKLLCADPASRDARAVLVFIVSWQSHNVAQETMNIKSVAFPLQTIARAPIIFSVSCRSQGAAQFAVLIFSVPFQLQRMSPNKNIHTVPAAAALLLRRKGPAKLYATPTRATPVFCVSRHFRANN